MRLLLNDECFKPKRFCAEQRTGANQIVVVFSVTVNSKPSTVDFLLAANARRLFDVTSSRATVAKVYVCFSLGMTNNNTAERPTDFGFIRVIPLRRLNR